MNLTYEEAKGMVAEFMDAFGAMEHPELAMKLVVEESKEVVEAFSHLMKEVADATYVQLGYINALERNPGHESRAIYERLSAEDKNAVSKAHDIIAMVTSGGLSDDLQAALFKAVHESNMSKLGENGKPIYREDGKVLKGPNYQPPNVEALVSRMALT